MFKPKRVLFFFSTFLLLIFNPLLFAEETVTITTYYPSPYGVYSSLQVDKLGVGDNSGDNILNSADVPTTSGDAWIKGSVGIGTMSPQTKLDVAGGVKMGSESTCNSFTEGTQRYNSGSKQMEFCNGTMWAAIGAGFGSIQAKSPDTAYYADTDGFVMAIPGNNSDNYWSYIHGQIADSASGPWILLLRGQGYSPAGGLGSITMPVQKGKYWMISTAYGVAASSVYWMPVDQ